MIAAVLLIVMWVVMFVLYLRSDIAEARWLPWWRRYMPSAFFVLTVLYQSAAEPTGWRNWFAWACLITAVWNSITATRNKRNGRDCKKLDAAEAERLTEVQQAAFQREATEAA